MSIARRTLLKLLASGAIAPAFSRAAWPADYPTRSVRIVVTYPAGGGADTSARIISNWLSERLGQSFVVENRGGAGGNIGTEAVVTAPADGYTLLQASAANAINATLYEKLSFNFIRDFEPIASLVGAPHLMFVTPSFPAKTVAEFIAYAKANPGKVTYASAGVGSSNHVSAEMFKMMTGVDLVHVPYRGGAPALTDLMGGQVQMMFSDILTAGGQWREGKIRALAVGAASRLPTWPDLPTVAETVPGFEATSWWGLCAPRGTPGEIISKLNAEVNAGLRDPKIKQRLTDLGVLILGGSPAQFSKMIADETEKWGKVVKFAKIKVG
jgi:tripartite-type tricarboxylate transporter receptor subunit TctC